MRILVLIMFLRLLDGHPHSVLLFSLPFRHARPSANSSLHVDTTLHFLSFFFLSSVFSFFFSNWLFPLISALRAVFPPDLRFSAIPWSLYLPFYFLLAFFSFPSSIYTDILILADPITSQHSTVFLRSTPDGLTGHELHRTLSHSMTCGFSSQPCR